MPDPLSQQDLGGPIIEGQMLGSLYRAYLGVFRCEKYLIFP